VGENTLKALLALEWVGVGENTLKAFLGFAWPINVFQQVAFLL